MSEVKAAKLTANQIDLELKNLPEWRLNGQGELERSITLAGFPQALIFVNAVGLLAESKNHHPDILVQWNKVRLSLTTHDSGGITMKDFELARLVNTLPI